MTELLSTKLFIPPLRTDLVPRPRLVQLMHAGLQAGTRLTLVSAPAGFGKTTLVVAWLKEIQYPAAWLSLEAADNDLPRFLAYLAAALQTVDEGLCAPLLGALQSSQLPPIEKILTVLLNEIAQRRDPLILVLDDYHQVTGPAITGLVAFILQHQPPQLHLVITTREDPALPLARLRALDQITEMRARDLRFTPEEVEAFLSGIMGLQLSRQDLAALEDRTEGWVVGLKLAGLSMQKQADLKAFIADFSGSHRHILDYLTGEVLRQQPESVRAFLLHTAILDRLNGPLCEALTGWKDSQELLARLEEANLFVIPLDEKRLWYRYHHLFADLLLNQLTRTHPERIPELHLRASLWFEQNGDIHAAVEHALQSADPSLAARLIEQHTMPRLYQGEVAKVIGWFDRLPEETLQSAPMLCIYKAWALVLMQRGARREEVGQALQTAGQALERVNAGDELRDRVAGHAASIRAFLLRNPALISKQPERLIALCHEAQQLLPAEEKAIRSTAALNMAYGYLALADLESARLAFIQAQEDGIAGGNYYAAIYGPINLILIALLGGRLREALQLCEANIDRFNRLLAGQYFPPIGALHIHKGSILVECDDLAGAGQALTEGLELVRWAGEAMAPKRGYTALARLRAIQDDRLAMLETLRTLEETWPEGVLYTQALRHRLSLRHWPEDIQVQAEASTWLAHSGIEFETLPVIISLDPVSTTSFETYLNAAHVLARLALANPAGYNPEGALAYLKRQQDFAAARGFVAWVVECALARAVLCQAAGKKEQALEALEWALKAAGPAGLMRTFIDECDLLQALLEEATPRLSEESLRAYAGRLLGAMSCGPSASAVEDRTALLSDRELEVLRSLASGLTYEETGRQLFLSLNTVQFHVKNIYSKLLVNKRVQAIEKARQLNLI